MTNRTLLTVIAVVLVGIFTIMLLERGENPFDSVNDTASNAIHELQDEADDLTSN